MGRTVIPYSNVVEAEHGRWLKFRRALRKEDQALFDALFEMARRHTQAGAYSSMPIPLHPILMSMLIDILRAHRELEHRLQRLEEILAEKKDFARTLNFEGLPKSLSKKP